MIMSRRNHGFRSPMLEEEEEEEEAAAKAKAKAKAAEEAMRLPRIPRSSYSSTISSSLTLGTGTMRAGTITSGRNA
jgi:hypothetical protein